MNRSGATSLADIRVSPRLPILTLAALGVILGAFAEALGLLPKAVLVILLLETLAGVAWLVARWRPYTGAALAITTLIIAVLLADASLRAPGMLTLLAIPCSLAAATIGTSAAGVAAVGETVLLCALAGLGVAGADPPEIAIALIAIWTMLATMIIVYRPVHQVVTWSWEHFQHAQSLLEKARDQRLELKQALQDLADANLQLTRLNRLAQGLRQAAEEARASKQQFVANVSHELRTPLNMILGFSEMILQTPESYGTNLPRALLADLNVILRNSRHLASLIDDVLDLSQIEAGRMALVKERVSMAEVIEAAVVAVRPLYNSKGLSLETDLEEDLPPVFCDGTRMQEVVLNLLSNAGRFTERGGVRVILRRDGGDVTISVADTGPGIAAGDLQKLFQPFEQLDGSLRRLHTGSGLGLSISKSFVELHGGEMRVESELGVGTTFHVRLPIDPAVSAAETDASRWFNPYWHYEERTRPSAAPLPTIHPRFVILESGGTLYRLVNRYLDGVETVAVGDIGTAIQELARLPAQALLLNSASVLDCLQQLNQSPPLPYGTPAIICSVPGEQEAAVSLGIADYLLKPVSQDRLLAALDRLQLKGKTILIVDDELETQQLFQRMLARSERGYRVLRASDGRQALSLMREEQPDAVLLDLAMPHMDGFQLLEARSHDERLCNIPVVVISARDPSGQPIVSNALAVVHGGGMSMPQLLACVQAISGILSVSLPAGPKQPERLPG